MTGADLKTLRESLNLSAQELADILDIKAERSVRRWEDGSRAVPDDVAETVLELEDFVESLSKAWAKEMPRTPSKSAMVLLRYESAEVFQRYQGQSIPYAYPHRFHSAALGRLAREMRRGSRVLSIVSMDPEAYEAWRFQLGLEDDSSSRTKWAKEQISK